MLNILSQFNELSAKSEIASHRLKWGLKKKRQVFYQSSSRRRDRLESLGIYDRPGRT